MDLRADFTKMLKNTLKNLYKSIYLLFTGVKLDKICHPRSFPSNDDNIESGLYFIIKRCDPLSTKGFQYTNFHIDFHILRFDTILN